MNGLVASDGADSGWRVGRSLLHLAPFRHLVTGQMLGQAADGLIQITFAQVVLFEVGQGATPWEITKLLMVSLIPFSVIGPFAGVLIDRFDRRRVLIGMSLVRAALGVAAIAIVTAAGQPLAYVALLLLLSTSRFILAAKGAALPLTVGGRDLVTANAVSSIGGMVAAFLGAVVGSTFVAAVPAAGAIVAAMGYLLAAAVFERLPGVGGRATTERLGAGLRRVMGELRDGLVFVARTSAVRTPLLSVALFRLLLGLGFVVLVLVADERYDLEAPGYGMALAVTGIGAFLGTWLAPIMARHWRRRALLPVAFVAGALAAIVGATAPNLAPLVASVGFVALAFQILKVIVDSLVQEGSPDAVRGRVFSIYDMVYNVSFVLAALALVPAWAPGREAALLRMVAIGFLLAAGGLAAVPRRPPRRPSAPVPPRRRWGLRLAAMAAGAIPALAFPAPSVWILGFVGLVPLLGLLAAAPTPREAAWRGWLGGAGYMVATHQWLVPTIGVFTLPAGVLLGALWIPWAVVAHLVLRRRSPPALVAAVVVVPAAFVVTEYVRSWDRLGGAWGVLGATQWNNELTLATAWLGGIWLVSAALVAVNVVGLVLVWGPPDRTRLVAAAAGVLVVGGMVGVGVLRPTPEITDVMRIGGVQAGVIHDPAVRFDVHEALSAGLEGAELDLVVWAESSVGFDLDTYPEYAARLRRLSQQLGAPVLVNVDARRSGDRGIAKAAVLVEPDGVTDRYDKMRLVPFGEYIPMRSALGWIADVSDAAAEDRRPGDRLVVMDVGAGRIGPLVCFESAFPDLTRELTDAGADVVVLQTATTTFQGSWAQPQHASLAAVRAMESGRSVVHASVSGVTAVFGPEGERRLWVEDGVIDTWVVTVPVTDVTTPYRVIGDRVPEVAMMLLIVAALVAGLRSAHRTRQAVRETVLAAAGPSGRNSRDLGSPNP